MSDSKPGYIELFSISILYFDTTINPPPKKNLEKTKYWLCEYFPAAAGLLWSSSWPMDQDLLCAFYQNSTRPSGNLYNEKPRPLYIIYKLAK